jgi:Na+-translocating ferredoxin:NAD+ oxidoreductase subunit E
MTSRVHDADRQPRDTALPSAAETGPLSAARVTTPSHDLLRGVWRENPVLVQMLGLCPALAVTNSVANALAMSIATCFVLLGSSVLVATFKRLIPPQVRITAYILIIATFVTIADLVLAAVVPDIHKALGAFIALIVVNCMILGRQESFASKRPVARAALDAAGTGAGFTLALVTLGAVREVLGNGSFLGVALFGPNFEPWIIMILPPGGFFTLGIVLLVIGAWHGRRAPKRPQPRSRVHAAVPTEVA